MTMNPRPQSARSRVLSPLQLDIPGRSPATRAIQPFILRLSTRCRQHQRHVPRFSFRNAGSVTTPQHVNKLYVDGKDLLTRPWRSAGRFLAQARRTSTVVVPADATRWRVSRCQWSCVGASEDDTVGPGRSSGVRHLRPTPAAGYDRGRQEAFLLLCPAAVYPNSDGFFLRGIAHVSDGRESVVARVGSCGRRPPRATCGCGTGSYCRHTDGFGPSVTFGPRPAQAHPH